MGNRRKEAEVENTLHIFLHLLGRLSSAATAHGKLRSFRLIRFFSFFFLSCVSCFYINVNTFMHSEISTMSSSLRAAGSSSRNGRRSSS